MAFKIVSGTYLLFLQGIVFLHSISNLFNVVASKEIYSQFIPNLISSVFPECKLFLISGNFDVSHDKMLQNTWQDRFSSIASHNKIISDSAGITNMDLTEQNRSTDNIVSENSFEHVLRPFRTISATHICYVVILLLPACLPTLNKSEFILHSTLNLPLLNPATFRNIDKFVILSNSTCIESLYQRKVIQKLKYKLFVTLDGNSDIFSLHYHCVHCSTAEKPGYLTDETQDVDYFPDFQQNFHGSALKISATDKLPGLLEIETDPKTGENFPKRGVYALALGHLAKGLNFTWKLSRSSGGGSTGHPLKNGTWLGSVGDIISGDVDFGIVCGMTFIRHPVIELCATITYEYISYAVGPRSTVYSWKAIFWPFKGILWVGMIMATVSVIIASYFLLQYSPYAGSPWGICSVAQYFPRVFIEQADNLPSHLPQSVKIIVGFWLLFALIGSTVYRAKMVGLMTFPVLEAEPENFDELSRSKYDIQFHYFGNVAYNTFKTSTSPTYMTIFQKMKREPDPLKCLKKTLDTSVPSSCILFGCVYEELKNRNLSDRFGQSPIRISPNYGFMYTPGVLHEKKADFSSNFKWILQNAMQMGLNQQWLKRDMMNLLIMRNVWLKTLNPREKLAFTFSYDGGTTDVLHLENLKGAFSVLFVGLFLSIVTYILEKAKQRWIKP